MSLQLGSIGKKQRFLMLVKDGRKPRLRSSIPKPFSKFASEWYEQTHASAFAPTHGKPRIVRTAPPSCAGIVCGGKSALGGNLSAAIHHHRDVFARSAVGVSRRRPAGPPRRTGKARGIKE